MRMKQAIGIVFILVGLPVLVWACGTLESRYESYAKAQNDEERFIELKFLNCESIVNTYSGSAEQSSKILDLVEKALIAGDKLASIKPDNSFEWKEMYYKDLAVKLFIRFECYNPPSIKRQSEISWRIRQAYDDDKLNFLELVSKLPQDHWLHSDADLGEPSKSYAALLRSHVKMLFGS